MIEPRALSALLAGSQLDTVKAAIVAALRELLLGVTIVAHPGKLDINDVVAGDIVQVPGVAIGWSRARFDGQVDGNFNDAVDWVAYIVAEDHADLATRQATPRDVVAHAIGSAILEILGDADTASWGIPGLDLPSRDPGPALTPMFTSKVFEKGTVYYAVTWSQTLWRQGRSRFGGPTPDWALDGASVAVEFPDDRMPAEVQAIAGRFFRNDGDV